MLVAYHRQQTLVKFFYFVHYYSTLAGFLSSGVAQLIFIDGQLRMGKLKSRVMIISASGVVDCLIFFYFAEDFPKVLKCFPLCTSPDRTNSYTSSTSDCGLGLCGYVNSCRWRESGCGWVRRGEMRVELHRGF